MSSSAPLSPEEVERRRAVLRALQEESPNDEVSPVRWGYRMVACVLSSFDPQTMRPKGAEAGDGGALRWLVEDCEVVSGADGSTRWMLKESVRRQAIARLRRPGWLRQVLQSNPVEQPDLLQGVINQYVGRDVGDGLDPDELLNHEFAKAYAWRREEPDTDPTKAVPSPLNWWDDGEVESSGPAQRDALEDADRLAMQLQVVRWYGRVIDGPARSAKLEAKLSQRLARARLLAPFRKLAGPTFRGRKDEREKLRVHVGVLDRSVTQTLSNYARRVLGMGEDISLLIHGPGGMGKSALLARFLLEHSETVPYAYLDFDNPHVSLDRPATLLLEASRQLALQYPDSLALLSVFEDRCRKALVDERQRRTGGRREGQSPGSAREIWVPLAEEFGELLMMQVLHHWAEQGGPYLLLLDTFEEVQHRNADLVRDLEHLLAVLRSRYPQLRVVLSGRAPEPGLKGTELVLKGLDEDSALSLLEASGVEDADLRRGLYAQVGGNPLSLKLAAEVARVEGAEAEGLRGLKTKRLFFFAAREAVVQGQLYRRVLEHVHDPAVRKLAHPGLIVRRLTPDIIQEVLAEPCGLGDLSGEQAQHLFEQLQREVSLVFVGPDGALYHRPDVRRVMLEPLRLDQPTKVAAIHAAAVRYYAQQSDVVSRAEELYHLMASGQPREVITPRWMPGVEPYLRSSLEELPAELQAYACSYLGVDLPRKVWEQAQLEDWERHVVRRLKELLLKGEPRWALEVLRERRERTPGSVLYVIEARVLILLKQQDEAERLIEEGLDSAGWGSGSVNLLKLLLLRALLVAERGDLLLAVKLVEEADQFAADRVCEPARVLPLMANVRLRRLLSYGSQAHVHAVKSLALLLLRQPIEELNKALPLYRRALDLLIEVELTQPGEELDALSPLFAGVRQWRRGSLESEWEGRHARSPALSRLVGRRTEELSALAAEPLTRLLAPGLMSQRYWEQALQNGGPTLKPPEGVSFGPLGFLLELMS